MDEDQSALSDYEARGIDVSAPPMSRYASQLLSGLAREFSGGQSFTRQSLLAEIGSQLRKANGRAPSDATIARVSKTALSDLLAFGFCSPTSRVSWALTERGEIAALAMRRQDSEALAESAVSFDVEQFQDSDTDLDAAVADPYAREVLAMLEARIARLEAERVEAERVEAARLEAERVEAARVEAERLEAARLEAERVEAARLEAERVEAVRARGSLHGSRRAGSSVLCVLARPNDWPPRSCSRLQAGSRECGVNRCKGIHAFDPLTFLCTRRGCAARRDEPGQTYLLAPDTRPLVQDQALMFGDVRRAATATAPAPRDEPGQGALFG